MELAESSGEKPGVHEDRRRQAFDALERRAHSLRAAPVLPDDHKPTQVKLIEKADEVGDMVGERQRRVVGRMVGVAGADPVRRDRAIARGG